jgi:hypothetical protein
VKRAVRSVVAGAVVLAMMAISAEAQSTQRFVRYEQAGSVVLG